MKRFVLLISLLCLCGSHSLVFAAQKPNVVFVITDDQGFGDLSCHGNPVLKTPQLDRLHDEAIRLRDYHVAPTCSPTRGALLTGHWTNRTGVWHTIMGRSLLRANERTLGQIFKDAGYATGMFGKWHLGDNYPYRPEDRGFTEVMRHGGGGVGQTPDFWDNAYFDGSYFHNGQPEAVKGFCTDVWFKYARRFIQQQKKAGKPFLAYISTNAPHGPMHCPPQYSAPYKEQGTGVANFLGMIANIDENVGKLRAFLDEQGLAQNTIFVFTTDNGTSSGDKVFNAQMRGKKGSEYDGGHRVPFFVYWPGGGLTGGRDVQAITAHVDVVPTLIDLCGIKPPQGVRFDGRSIRALLEGEPGNWPDRILITDSQRVKDPIKWRKSAVMTSQWRLVNGAELYDIKADPSQKEDVSQKHPQVVKRLKTAYEDWWAELEPTFAQDCPLTIGHAQENPACLTGHDWITTGSSPWNQRMIRMGEARPATTGHWIVKVAQAGQYEIRLRRWPKEADAPIDAGLNAGADVPGAKAYRAHPGKALAITKASVRIGRHEAEQAVQPGAKEAVFKMRLQAGVTQLHTRFHTREGQALGAYYAYVERLNPRQDRKPADSSAGPTPRPKPATDPPNEVNEHALREAALEGLARTVQVLLRQGTNANAADENGRTALMLAAFNGHTTTVRELIKQGAHINTLDQIGRNALIYAASGPNKEVVQLLLKHQANPNIVDKEEEWTALMFAAAEGHAQVVQALLQNGADASLQDIDGETAYDFAVNKGHAEVARILVDARAR